ncbi:TerC family protein [Paraburkholderia silvatlantica]|uniref:YjbE family integral membrane protein n=1 Tax=Paraburkholderia silvatlantica TaxID=321895 RepID=A0ABR6FQH4_9BURK|nr:TerC family protein [Paraburkholderia silvatlantica]MBB2929674.1 YjbE family integral membrane protein [Paraburkholderia silvatlantica]PVY35027.1 YjbE family integral membrane protein [Paraburkholderia silvatlantica]PXW39437.1 YjbE family integral membrane protein [Paraburkholderia silvatlantica]
MLEFFASLHWGAVIQIIVIDILLGGDNAVVIALACRDLPSQQRMRGILWGTAGAIALRVVLIAFAVVLLNVPFLKFAGGLLLLWIGVRLLAPSQLEHANVKPAEKLMGAIKTIVVADAVMSLDNVVAIAGAAEAADSRHRIALVIFGLMVSIPLIVWGSQLVLKLLDRYPVIVTLGAALLGWIAGGLIVNDPAGDRWPLLDTPAAEYGMSVAGAVFVVALGTWLRRRNARRGTAQGPQSH